MLVLAVGTYASMKFSDLGFEWARGLEFKVYDGCQVYNMSIFPHGQSDTMVEHITVHCASCIKRPNPFTICSSSCFDADALLAPSQGNT